MSNLAGYSDTYLQCRRGNLGHVWTLVGYFQDGGMVKRRTVCARCDATKEDTWRPTAERIKSRYKHPDDYRIPGGASAQDVRVEVLSRVHVYGSEDEMLAGLF